MIKAEAGHDFRVSKSFSIYVGELPFWEQAYRTLFVHFQCMTSHPVDGDHQRLGIDRSVITDCGKCFWIDEKARGRNAKTGVVYGDIALEFVSNKKVNSPGWVVKSILSDYIAYAILPLGVLYLLPVPALQLAWKHHGHRWLREYGTREVFNEVGELNKGGWTAVFCPVPTDPLFAAMGGVLQFSFEPIDIAEGE